MSLVPESSWTDGCLFRRSQTEDSPSPPAAAHDKERGRPRFLCEFHTYLQEEVLCPTLERGQVIVMDNLPAHKGERVRKPIEEEGCELVYPPPNSPDFDPIKRAFSKLKGYFREACARSQQTLMEVIGEALSKITASDGEATSSTAATGRWSNLYDRCSKRP